MLSYNDDLGCLGFPALLNPSASTLFLPQPFPPPTQTSLPGAMAPAPAQLPRLHHLAHSLYALPNL